MMSSEDRLDNLPEQVEDWLHPPFNTPESNTCSWELLPFPLSADLAWHHLENIIANAARTGAPVPPPSKKDEEVYGRDGRIPAENGDVRWVRAQTTSFQRAHDMARRLQARDTKMVLDLRVNALSSEEQVTHVFDAFSSFWAKYMPAVEDIPEAILHDGLDKLPSLKTMAARVVLGHHLVDYDKDGFEEDENNDEGKKIPQELCWLLRGLRDRQKKPSIKAPQRGFLIRLEIGEQANQCEDDDDTQYDPIPWNPHEVRQQFVEYDDDGEPIATEDEEEWIDDNPIKRDLFYDRTEKRTWRYSHLSFRPHPLIASCDYTVSAPEGKDEDLSPCASAIAEALDLSSKGPQSWTSAFGHGGGQFMQSTSSTVQISPKDGSSSSTRLLRWKNVEQVKDAMCAMIRRLKKESVSKVWEKDAISMRIIMRGASAAELDLASDELQALMVNKVKEIDEWQVDKRCWFLATCGSDDHQYHRLERRQVEQVLRESVQGTAWVHVRSKLEPMSEDKRKKEEERLSKFVSDKFAQVAERSCRLATAKGGEAVEGQMTIADERANQPKIWQTSGEGIYECIITIDKKLGGTVAPSLTSLLPLSSKSKEGDEWKNTMNHDNESEKTRKMRDEWWKLELGCFQCFNICRARLFYYSGATHPMNYLCSAHKGVLLSENHSPLPLEHVSFKAAQALVERNMYRNPPSFKEGLVDADGFIELLGGLRCGYITSRSSQWGKENINEKLFQPSAYWIDLDPRMLPN